MEVSEYLSTVGAMHREGRRRGLFFLAGENESLNGRDLSVAGEDLVSFSSCSYLGLEFHPALRQGVIDAVTRYGTQFSSSRGYVSAPPYAELEALLSELFGGHALVMPSTTLGHQVALPVLASEKDAIVLDHQVHHSVQMAATLARAGGTRVETVKHRELERAVDLVASLAGRHRTVWFAGDGVYSMYGDLAPVTLLRQLLDAAPNVRLYIDDAHGMSWAGRHGRGSFLSRMPDADSRVVLATSLNKAFAAGGGVLVFPTEEERERVRTTGAPLVFSGPVQPPMLGAALASARLHLSDEIVGLQRTYHDRATLVNRLLREAALPLLVENESPIFFLRIGLPAHAMEVAERVRRDGHYVNVSMYPSVPMRRSGIRLSVTAAHSPDQIRGVIDSLARHVPAVLAENGIARHELDDLFATAVPAEARTSTAPPGDRRDRMPERPVRDAAGGRNGGAPVAPVAPQVDLTLDHATTVHDLDRDEWDRLLGRAGASSWEGLRMVEESFRGQERREHNWGMHYLIVRDREGAPVAATFLAHALSKDDMLMRHEVSAAIEERRRAGDPYFLTSEALVAGGFLSEGNHLWLDRSGPWRQALGMLLRQINDVGEQTDARVLLLRDLPADDPEVEAVMLESGFVKAPVLDSHELDLTWGEDEEWLMGVSRKARKRLYAYRRHHHEYPRQVFGGATGRSLDDDALDHLHALYRAVAEQKLRLNVFELPPNLLRAVADSPAWEVVTVTRDPEAGGPADGRPVAWAAAHVHDGHYAPFFCGLDYEHVHDVDWGAYRQLLLHLVERAREIGCHTLHLGMDADFEKSRFGTTVVSNCVYVQARDHENAHVLRDIVAEVGLEAAA